VRVNDLASLLNTVLEDSEGGRVGDHESSEVVLVLLGLGSKILHVELSSSEDLDGDDLETSHDSGLRIRKSKREVRWVKRRWRRKEGRRRTAGLVP